MARTLSTLARAQLSAQSSHMSLPVLVSITHDYAGLSSPMRICNNNVSLTYGGNVYYPYAFTFDPPDVTQDSIANASITMDATDQQAIELVRGVTDPPTVTVIAAFYIDIDGTVTFEEVMPLLFTLKNVTFGVNTVSGDLIYEDRLDNQMGPIEFSPQVFPGHF